MPDEDAGAEQELTAPDGCSQYDHAGADHPEPRESSRRGRRGQLRAHPGSESRACFQRAFGLPHGWRSGHGFSLDI
jgi:hypothetical protein